ncbi:MAG: hypothetical protein Tsb002_01230 [Wenzhouxiangellaceae bacterium]
MDKDKYDQQSLDLLKRAFEYANPDKKDSWEKLDLEAPIETLGIQSITALEMAGFIEDELNHEFPDREIAKINTLKNLLDLISATRTAKA